MRVAPVVCTVVPISVGAAVISVPTPIPAHKTLPELLSRKHDARAPPERGVVQFENWPTGARSAAVHGNRAAVVPTPTSPLVFMPQHTMDVGALFNTVAQLVYMPKYSLPNCSPAAASTGFTRE